MSNLSARQDRDKYVHQAIRNWELKSIAAQDPQVETMAIGPFCAAFDHRGRVTPVGWVSLVGPMPDSGDLPQWIEAIEQAFAVRQAPLQVEFDEILWPTFGSALEEAGLCQEWRHPLMALLPDDFRPRQAADVIIHRLKTDDPDDRLLAFAGIRSREEPGVEERGPEIARALREGIGRPESCYLLGLLDGTPAGTALLHATDEIGEIVGVVTRPAFRRRGVASTLCSHLAQWHFASGGSLVFLDAEDDRARSVYERIGFGHHGYWVSYTR